MSDTPPHASAHVNGRDKTPELVSSREKRRREDEEDDRDANRDRSHRNHSGRSRREEGQDQDQVENDQERWRERERRHRRHREDITEEDQERWREREERHRRRREEEAEEERRERHRRRDEETEEERKERRRRREEETEEEREERHKRRRERDYERERERRYRDRSRESHRSSISHRQNPRSEGNGDERLNNLREMTREEKQAEREKRDREMAEEKREAARAREARFAEIDRERELERRKLRDEERGMSPMRRPRRGSPSYSSPVPPREREREPRDPATALLQEVEKENRSIFISQLSARLTSHDLGSFFEDKLGRGAVRDARVVTDKVTRRSKGIGYVELDAVELVSRAVALTGTIVMGLPINVMLTESERNREGLALPPGLDVDAHRDAAIPFHRLYISNLSFSLSADDLQQVFEPFGEIEFVDLHIDFSGMKKGTGYVQYKDLKAAQMALDAMAGFELAGRPIRVQTVQDRAYVAAEQIEDNGNYGTRLDANQRQQLMFKLARTEPTSLIPRSKTPLMNPTPFIIVSNMFNPDEETERNWDLDLAEDVKGEVETKYGKVKRIKVEKLSAGEVYIEFGEIEGATSAIKGLNGRFFGGRQLQASYISEALFKAHF
uniref:RNA-binding protein 39 n=1 Tax=Kwoniella pini CBS 10737 TaxID=1296096 RepID=A0A1B9I3Z1_9TREE|nr:RNA-binding protein 39 [Kwoniella pini CBS 10737]OCF50201.1 RNA-binding protein 39 [Kwoniella pini CBS 10737]